MPLVPRLPDVETRLRGLRRDLEDLKRRAISEDPAIYPIKLNRDGAVLTTGSKFVFGVTAAERLNGLALVKLGMYVSTVASSGTTTVQITKLPATTMLTTPITIDAGENFADTAAVPYVINAVNDDVATGDLIDITVTAAGVGAMGLGIVLVFG